MLQAFDDSYVGESSTKGGKAKKAVLTDPDGEIRLAEERSGLHDLIQTLREAFAYRYYNPRAVPNRDEILAAISDRAWLVEVFRNALAKGNWPTSNKSLSYIVPNAGAPSRKRNSDQAKLESRIPKQSKVHRWSQHLGSRDKEEDRETDVFFFFFFGISFILASRPSLM